MDLAFDAGGKVSVGLTATTIVSQWTWAATLLQSSAVGSKVSFVPRCLAFILWNKYTETDRPWAASAVEAAQELLAAAHGQLQKLPMGSHLCTGSLWVKSVLTHGQLLITHGQHFF